MKRLRTGVWLILALLLCAALPCIAKALTSGELSVKQEYNNGGKLLSSTYVDREGRVTLAEDKGYAIVRYTYDRKNRLLKTEYLDTEERLTDISQGG